MKKVLLAIDDTRGSKAALETYIRVFPCLRPETTVLLYVEKFEGRSLMDEMLPDSEIDTLREVLHGTEYQEALDRKAEKILNYYKKELENSGATGIKAVIRSGQPAEEILGAAKDEGVEMIIIGSRGKRVGHLFMGSVSREVANNAEVPVLLAR
ncbi:MAG TPA: universal stress protein [Thermodesulfovibrionales bacterium]|nr:universal stress protein [Thermodesulfovibrionales bacterium]